MERCAGPERVLLMSGASSARLFCAFGREALRLLACFQPSGVSSSIGEAGWVAICLYAPICLCASHERLGSKFRETGATRPFRRRTSTRPSRSGLGEAGVFFTFTLRSFVGCS